MKLRNNHYLPLIAPLLLVGAGEQTALAQPAQAPNSDFPMVVGAPYTIGSTSYTPADTMNYDAVGYAEVGGDANTAITAAHHTLPVPSYVEVTALNTGRTILVRVTNRGPMDSNRLIALSAGAAAQLGVGDNAAVRVRRVNPPENERELLRAGSPAPQRMNTPAPLLAVLTRKLQPGTPVGLNPSTANGAAGNGGYPSALPPRGGARPAWAARGKPPVIAPSVVTGPAAAMPPTYVPQPQPYYRPKNPVYSAPPAPPADEQPTAEAHAPHAAWHTATHTGESLVIQAGAFADKARAAALAAKIGGTVRASGHIYRVRKGPYATRYAADAALAKVRAAGYSGARIEHAD